MGCNRCVLGFRVCLRDSLVYMDPLGKVLAHADLLHLLKLQKSLRIPRSPKIPEFKEYLGPGVPLRGYIRDL